MASVAEASAFLYELGLATKLHQSPFADHDCAAHSFPLQGSYYASLLQNWHPEPFLDVKIAAVADGRDDGVAAVLEARNQRRVQQEAGAE